MNRILRTFVLFLCFCSIVSAVELNLPQELPAHPRLFFTKQREAEIKERIKTDPFLDKIVKELIQKADKQKTEPVTDYKIPDGRRLLGQSRRCVERTTTLAFAYRMTGNKEYVDAAIAEMLAVCRFEDWHPSHFLDTAELAFAVGCGYDWLYDAIPREQRTEIKDALVRHGLQVGLESYQKKLWWTARHNNWNEVCNGGLTVGALAIADENRELAEQIFHFALASFPHGLAVYEPDGAYPEGPGYWVYGQTYSEFMIFALKDALGNDFDFSKTKGLNTTGDYLMGMISTTNHSFNYADGASSINAGPAMFALARLFNRPDYAYWLKTHIEQTKSWTYHWLAAFHPLWYIPATEASFTETPLAAMWKGTQDICSMRTSWTDTNAAFFAIKGGDNQTNHGHLDIGSFVYEVNGVCWAVDLGGDNYNLPGYWDTKNHRWDIFRLNNRSHNTLVIGDQLQNFFAVSKIVLFENQPADNVVARTVVDMTDAYKDQTQSARRTATLQKDGSVIIEDELEGVTKPVRWGMMTGAAISIDGKVAVLSEQGKTLRIEIKSDGVTTFDTISAAPPTEKEKPNKGFNMLTALATPKDGKVSLRVVMKPDVPER